MYWSSQMMRINKHEIDKSFVEELTENKNNYFKIQQAIKDLDLKETADDVRLSKLSSDGNLTSVFPSSDIESLHYSIEEEIDCRYLDGWENERPMETKTINKSLNQLYDFIGI